MAAPKLTGWDARRCPGGIFAGPLATPILR